MSIVELAKTRKEVAEKTTDKLRSVFVRYVFEKPGYVRKQESSLLSIPIRSASLEKLTVETVDKVYVEAKYLSKLPDIFDAPDKVYGTTFPRWRWEYSSDTPPIKTVVDTVSNFLNGQIISAKPEDLTRIYHSMQNFKIARQLIDFVNSGARINSITIPNKYGGVDIVAKVSSFTDPEKQYDVVVSVVKEKDGAKVRFSCTCPIGSDHTKPLMCKHVMAVIWNNLATVLAAIEAVELGKTTQELGYFWDEKLEELKQDVAKLKTSYNYVDEAVAYYILKYIAKYYGVKLPSSTDKYSLAELVEKVFSGDTEIIEKREVKTKDIGGVAVRIPTAEIQEIQYPEWAEQLREKLEKTMTDMSEKFGILSETFKKSDWAKMLVFSAVASADYTKPPIVLHAVGDIGTFKTTGARLLSEYINVPVIRLSYEGSDVSGAYTKFLSIVEKYLPVKPAMVGGIISMIRVSSNELHIDLNLPAVLSYLKREYGEKGKEKLDELLMKLRKFFKITSSSMRQKITVLDPAQLSNIEDYRFRYEPTKIGLLRIADAFDGILVIDEGSRNPSALENLLTKLSLASEHEGLRIAIITDNIEPFQEVITNPRYAPLHDRTFKVVTPAFKDEVTVSKKLPAKPSVILDAVELLALHNVVDFIPVPEVVSFLTKSIGFSLAYKYGLTEIEGWKVVVPIRRGEEANFPIIYDVFENIPEFAFIPGGRFLHHTIQLAKFNAFMNMHKKVELDDLKEALNVTVRSRLVFEDVETYLDYKLRVLEVLSVAHKHIKVFDENKDLLLAFLADLRKKNRSAEDTRRLASLYEQLLEKVAETPEILSFMFAAIELAVTTDELEIDTLPASLEYTIASYMLAKGDFSAIEKFGEKVYDLIKYFRGGST